MRGQSQTLASRACAHLSVALLANALIKAQHAFVRVPRGADSHPSACAATPVSLPLPRGLEAFIATNTDETTFLQKHTWGGAAGELDLDAKTATEVSIYIYTYIYIMLLSLPLSLSQSLLLSLLSFVVAVVMV